MRGDLKARGTMGMLFPAQVHGSGRLLALGSRQLCHLVDQSGEQAQRVIDRLCRRHVDAGAAQKVDRRL